MTQIIVWWLYYFVSNVNYCITDVYEVTIIVSTNHGTTNHGIIAKWNDITDVDTTNLQLEQGTRIIYHHHDVMDLLDYHRECNVILKVNNYEQPIITDS